MKPHAVWVEFHWIFHQTDIEVKNWYSCLWLKLPGARSATCFGNILFLSLRPQQVKHHLSNTPGIRCSPRKYELNQLVLLLWQGRLLLSMEGQFTTRSWGWGWVVTLSIWKYEWIGSELLPPTRFYFRNILL